MEHDPAGSTETEQVTGIDQSVSSQSDRKPLLVLVIGLLAVAALISIATVLFIEWRSDDSIDVDRAADPVTDLLSWLPANDLTSQSFAVWTPDTSPDISEGIDVLQENLAIKPFPLTLGHSVGWEMEFGWQVGQVTSWAVAGRGSEIAVLEGDFDQELIEQRLLDAGYKRGFERGVTLYAIDDDGVSDDVSLGDARARAAVIALLDGRLLISSSLPLVQSSIDAVLDGTGSLADVPQIAATLRTIAPVSAIVGIDQAHHASECLPGLTPLATEVSRSQWVIVGYGRVGSAGEQRTLVVVTFAKESESSLNLVEFEIGWMEGFANAGGAGGNVEAFGRLTSVRQTGTLLTAELVDGRDGGWVRSGIRYAIPVCELTLARFPTGTPDPMSGQTELTVSERLMASLPLVESGGAQIVLDFEALSQTVGVSPPASGATAEEIASWEAAIGPLPVVTTFAMDHATLIAWTSAYGIPLASIRGVGESVVNDTRAPVGVLIGNWDIDRLTALFVANGYDWIERGGVRHFAFERDNPALALPNIAFRNIAILGDRMWFSDDQQLMRDMTDAAMGE